MKTQADEIAEAYRTGKIAGANGNHTNPYCGCLDLAETWEAGFNDGQNEDDDDE
jgi:hypothetical protein